MAQPLKDKIAAVTGGASGIGLECVRHLLDNGAEVYIIDFDAKAAEARAAELGDKAHALIADLTKYEDIEKAVHTIVKNHGRIDIFHANAGSYVADMPWEGDTKRWDRMLDLNINAAFRCVRAVAPQMMEQKSGDIVITSSISGMVPMVSEPVYTASKHAVQAFVHTARRKLAAYDVRISAIQPGPVVTPLLKDWDQERVKANLESGGIMQPVEVAEALIFMLTRRKGVIVRDLVILPQNFDV
ncbi:Ribitol 2-dehydrogenase [Acetobacteraceae bacterium EV16G]|uniref:Ribitol 2-dehydrogenase n=1 Tax=Sorlinia euscelidii TaxID=3081148 RepID=A0ABU7U1W1_9PROT